MGGGVTTGEAGRALPPHQGSHLPPPSRRWESQSPGPPGQGWTEGLWAGESPVAPVCSDPSSGNRPLSSQDLTQDPTQDRGHLSLLALPPPPPVAFSRGRGSTRPVSLTRAQLGLAPVGTPGDLPGPFWPLPLLPAQPPSCWPGDP